MIVRTRNVIVALAILSCFSCSRESGGPAKSLYSKPVLTSTLPELKLIDYIDPQAGFEAQVPKGWRPVRVSDPNEYGYTVTFESPPSDTHDSFSDYLMIELLPGQEPAGFIQQPIEKVAMEVDGLQVYREHIALPAYPVADTTMNLVAWQLKLMRPSYSVGIYIVGEQRNDARLERILIEFAYSFHLPESPFKLSEIKARRAYLSG